MSSLPVLQLVDTHCHLNLSDFDSDRYLVLQAARTAGVNRFLVPGIDIETSRSAIAISGEFRDVYAAVGVHPNSASTWTNSLIPELRQLASNPKVVAIGEIGLDYYRNHAPHDVQLGVFRLQLDLAAELGLPVVIHNRDASLDILEMLQDWFQELKRKTSVLVGHPGVLHSFSGDLQVAVKALEMNFKLGITGPITYRNAQVLQSVVATTALENLLIETDTPFLAPHPYRGKRNEPANVRIVAEKIAELKQAPVEVVAKVTTESADQLFDWRSIH